MKKRITIVIIVALLTLAIAVPVAASAAGAVKGGGSLLDYCKGLIQQLVTDKKLAQSDADTVIAALDKKQQEIQVDRSAKDGKGLAPGLPLDTVATVLGLKAEDLQAKLQAGSTIWKIAADAGKLDALKDAIIKQLSSQLDAMVAAGRLTKEAAATQLANLTARIKAITADSKEPLRGLLMPGIDGRGHGRMDGGMRGPKNGSTPDQKTKPSAPAAKPTVPAANSTGSSS